MHIKSHSNIVFMVIKTGKLAIKLAFEGEKAGSRYKLG